MTPPVPKTPPAAPATVTATPEPETPPAPPPAAEPPPIVFTMPPVLPADFVARMIFTQPISLRAPKIDMRLGPVPEARSKHLEIPIPTGPGGLTPSGAPVDNTEFSVGVQLTLGADNKATKVEVSAGGKGVGVTKKLSED